ncbi:hypothetical protein FACS189499_06250 [Clostridia bacterium]|nr:hypothetical protein FACS189499_06250 [Clostridia bacterium]
MKNLIKIAVFAVPGIAVLSAIIAATSLISVSTFYNNKVQSDYNRKVEAWAELNKTAEQGGVVFVGDSHTELFPVNELFPDENAFNRGILGDTTIGLLTRLNESIFELQPSKIFLEIGTNDIAKTNDSDAEIAERIGNIIEEIQENAPDSELYIISLYPLNFDSEKTNKLTVWGLSNDRIVGINKNLEEICNKKDVPYIDIHSKLVDENGRQKEEYVHDGAHLNIDGYAVVADALRSLGTGIRFKRSSPANVPNGA